MVQLSREDEWKPASKLANKITGANSRPASQFESRGLRRCALVFERHGRYHGWAAVAQFCRWTSMPAIPLCTLVASVAIIFLTGCGTIATRVGGGGRDASYPATKADAYVISTGGGIYAAGDCNNGLGPVMGWLVIVPLHIVDLPVSLVTDTICLPFDARRAIRERERQSRTFEMRIGVATTNAPTMMLLDTSDQHFDGTPLSTRPWAIFLSIPSGETVTVIYGESFSCPGTTERYELKLVYYDRVSLEREKDKQIVQPDSAANGSQPIRSGTNRTSSAAGSRR
jgi:uncharacterized protein YceK